MRKLIILVTAITIGLFLVSCGGPAPATPPTPPAAPATPPPAAPPATTPATTQTIDAKALYATNCVACHGQNRQGIPNLAPALTPTSLASKSIDEIKTTITKGKTGTAMAGFEGRLTLAEIDALAELIKTVEP